MAKRPAEWALKRACELANELCGNETFHPDKRATQSSALFAFARYIEQHEDEPVDPLEKAVGDAFDMLPPEWNRETFVEHVAGTLRGQGIRAQGGAA